MDIIIEMNERAYAQGWNFYLEYGLYMQNLSKVPKFNDPEGEIATSRGWGYYSCWLFHAGNGRSQRGYKIHKV